MEDLREVLHLFLEDLREVLHLFLEVRDLGVQHPRSSERCLASPAALPSGEQSKKSNLRLFLHLKKKRGRPGVASAHAQLQAPQARAG